jgi:prepilin-type N-terminal cleavage/methylation domain-containing protein
MWDGGCWMCRSDSAIGFPRTASRAEYRAFTMIEVVVVVIVLAVLAGLAVPRLIGSSNRRGRREAESIAALLTQAVRRQMLTTQRVAVDFDSSDGRVLVSTLKPSDLSNFDARDRQWVGDPLLPAVALEASELASVSSNASTLNARHFHAELSDAGGRVSFSMVLRDIASGSMWTIRLPLASDRAVLTEGQGQRTDADGDADSIDLDQAGRRDSPW